jgi:hypothetical protein
MFADLDETIRNLLIKRVPIDLTEVDISFEAPDREWSGRLSRPTVNCFMYDVRENLDLRQTDWEVQKKNGTATSKRFPVRIDATYAVTVWARAPEDEHHLLWRVLTAFFKTPVIPEDILQGQLRGQPFPTRTVTVQPSQARANPAELWQALDNRIRPALTYTVTVPLDVDQEFTAPMVFTRRTRLWGGDADGGTPAAEGIQISGQVRDAKEAGVPVRGATVLLRETGAEYVTDIEGRFAFKVREGKITLEVREPGGRNAKRTVEVPAQDYDVEL